MIRKGCNFRLDLRGIALPTTARLAGAITAVPQEEFVNTGQPLFPSDGLYILVNTSWDWCFVRGFMVIAGQPESVLMNNVIWPRFIEHDELVRRIVRRETD